MDELTNLPIPIEDIGKYTDTAIELAITYAPKLILAIITLIIGLWVVNRVTAGLGKVLAKGGTEQTLQKFLSNLTNVGLKGLLFISVASMVGIETTSFIAILGAAGLAIGLALQGSLANFAGGVLILMFRPYKTGDFIETNGHMGSVKSIEIFNTIMTTGDNKTIIIPNGAISNNPITNFSMQDTRRVDIVFGISYDDDLRVGKDVLTKLIEADERIHSDPAPLVVISSLGDSCVNITTRSWVDSGNYWPVYFDLMENGKLGLEEAGLSIPYPQQDVYVHQQPAA
ncbi:MAG: small conductance mechanosensitive channel [Candidatus Azotimanducaceae bacterium]|jgi:small conductance mechanosensitive channel